ncbi:glycosyltransferase family 4 protein [Paraburkholderia sp. BR14263]|uniref:glycosyltransferase family 4 protein n=1 Tax=unclassified Paraburkholderia TaxID=2615204 RepID=UPI0034CED9EB
MTQIYLDITRLLKGALLRKRPTGVDRVGLAYVQHYGERAVAAVCIGGFCAALSPRASARLFSAVQTYHPAGRLSLTLTVLRGLLFGSRRLTRGGMLLHTSHSGAESGRYFRSLRAQGVHVACMIHDLIPLSHPEFCRPGTAQQHDRRMRIALASASAIIANSQATLDAVNAYARREGLSLPRTVVAQLAPGTTQVQSPAPLVAGPYFVMVGTIEPRKNHWFILQLWRRLVAQFGAAAPRLVLVGRQGWKYENVISMLDECAELQHAVVFEPDCPDARLAAWLTHARALVFPSFAEGFGMPVAEALAAGVPVIASDLPVFREYAGDVPDYVDPLDGPAWLAKLITYANGNTGDRALQLARLQSYQPPGWLEHFARVDALLEELGAAP